MAVKGAIMASVTVGLIVNNIRSGCTASGLQPDIEYADPPGKWMLEISLL